jgi:hypothetical protein
MLGRNRIAIAVAVVASGLFGTASRSDAAGPATTAPTTGPAAAPAGAAGGVESMRVVIAEVTGLVQVRENETAKWQKAAVGMELGENAEFRTGPRSSVTCKIPPDQTFIIDRLGVMKVAEAARQGNQVRTDLIMKYGRTQYAIEAAGAQHESTIRSPSSTLAVRGTVVSLYDQAPFTTEARSFTGRAVFTTAKRQVALGAPGRGAKLKANQGTPAETALNESVVDPGYAPSRTSTEAQFIANEQARGGIAGFSNRLQITTIRNSPPLGDADLVNNLPGRLNFVLRWNEDADLDLVVDNQVGDPLQLLGNFQPQEFLYPGFGLDQTSTGGKIAFNHQGGPTGGQEIAYWGQNAPNGIYGVATLHSGGQAAHLRWDVFFDGQPLNILANKLDENGNFVPLRDPETGEIITDPGSGEPLPDLEIATTIERAILPNQQVVGIVLLPDPFAAPPPEQAALVGRRLARMVGPTASPTAKLAQAAMSGPPINARQAKDLRAEAREAKAAAREAKAAAERAAKAAKANAAREAKAARAGR